MRLNSRYFLGIIIFCITAITSPISHAQTLHDQAEQALSQVKALGHEWLIPDPTNNDEPSSLSQLFSNAKEAIAAGDTKKGEQLTKIVLVYSKLAIAQNDIHKTNLPTNVYPHPTDTLAKSTFELKRNLSVQISENQPFQDILHHGHEVRIQRIQDVRHRLTDDFALTSRPCPPFCIQPIEVAEGVRTIAELELLKFIDKENTTPGYLIDARLPDVYALETIPSAVNVPFIMFSSSAEQILPVLGAKKKGDTWDFSAIKPLAFFCNGPWCEQSPRAIKTLLKLGFPASKLFHYRGGLQAWKSFGLTTVQTKSHDISKSNPNSGVITIN